MSHGWVCLNSLTGQGPLPLVKWGGMDPVLVAQIEDWHTVDQMFAKDRGLLLGRVALPIFSHDGFRHLA